MLSLQSFLRKGVSLGYVGKNYNLKDLNGTGAPPYERGTLKLSEEPAPSTLTGVLEIKNTLRP